MELAEDRDGKGLGWLGGSVVVVETIQNTGTKLDMVSSGSSR